MPESCQQARHSFSSTASHMAPNGSLAGPCCMTPWNQRCCEVILQIVADTVAGHCVPTSNHPYVALHMPRYYLWII